MQFGAMPGVQWIRDAASPNGRGFYRGPREAVELVAATLEAAGVCKVMQEPHGVLPARAFIPANNLPEAFRDYQRDGASWCRTMLRDTCGALLADEMGLGKTPQAICALDGFDEHPRLVVCPAVVVPHWEAELAKWGDPDNGWQIYSWDKFARRQEELIKLPWSAGVFDELHYASNYNGSIAPTSKGAARAKAAHAFRKAHTALPIIGLTGTPMVARPVDLWSPLELLWPGRFGKKYDFAKRYCNGHYEELLNDAGQPILDENGEPLRKVWVTDGLSNSEELRARLAHCMLRRTKQQVGHELPPRTRVIVDIPLPAAARRDMKQALRSLDFSRNVSAVGVLIGNAEACKLPAAEALARDVLASGSRPLLLTTRRESAAQLGEALGCPHVTGEVAADTRQALIADAPCAAATLYSVETGINLTGFDVIIFVGLDWLPSRILQGESRIHRIGQDKPCTIYYLVARGTVDEVIKERVIQRLENFAAVTGTTGDESGLAKELAPESEDEIIAAIVAAARMAA